MWKHFSEILIQKRFNNSLKCQKKSNDGIEHREHFPNKYIRKNVLLFEIRTHF